MSTIPASAFVNVTPNVLAAGGSALDLNGLVLTTSTRVPVGAVMTFPSAASVGSFFGPTSKEAGIANVYFAGFDNSSVKPGAILFAQYNTAPVSAYLRGGNVSGLTLTQLQALSGTLSVTIDSILKTASINLSGATSFSNAAEIIAQALGVEGVQAATLTASAGATFTGTGTGTSLAVTSVTGIIHPGDAISGTGVPANTTIVSGPVGGGAGTYITNNATTAVAAAIVATSNVLDVTAVATGAIGVGDVLVGAGIASGTYVASQTSGTPGGIGLYVISGSPIQIVSEAVTAFTPAVQFDSVSGAFIILSGTTGATSTISFGSGALAISLLLTAATGAVLSQGAAAATPAAFMTAVAQQTQNWATFMLGFDPDAGSGNAQKLLFATWTSQQSDRYGFVCWDTDPNVRTQNPAASSLGQLLKASNASGTCLISELSDRNYASFICGAVASIDFEQPNGRIDLDFISQGGLVADCTDLTSQVNAIANGYNVYSAVASANQGFVFFTNGSVSGPFAWFNSYINQIWLNNALQLAGMELLTQSRSIPYNLAGYAMIEAAMADPINQAISFGAIRGGVALSSSQIAEVNAAAGKDIATVLQQRGWYLQVGDPGATVRAARGSPICVFWYVDGGDVQMIDLTSVLLS
jgi:hypothetical protein